MIGARVANNWRHRDDQIMIQMAVGMCQGFLLNPPRAIWTTVRSTKACAKGFSGTPAHLTAIQSYRSNKKPYNAEVKVAQIRLGNKTKLRTCSVAMVAPCLQGGPQVVAHRFWWGPCVDTCA